MAGCDSIGSACDAGIGNAGEGEKAFFIWYYIGIIDFVQLLYCHDHVYFSGVIFYGTGYFIAEGKVECKAHFQRDRVVCFV